MNTSSHWSTKSPKPCSKKPLSETGRSPLAHNETSHSSSTSLRTYEQWAAKESLTLWQSKITPSGIQFTMVIVLSAMSFSAWWVSPIPLAAQWLGSITTGLLCTYAIHYLKTPSLLSYRADNTWQWQRREVCLSGHSDRHCYRNGWLVILALVTTTGSPVYIPIWRDAVSRDAFSKLQFQLRYGAPTEDT
ncbi:MAG: hypothetical protein KTR35_12905 [Gammaproteobacteria bacterium]|nr:hypothetical protein [Gammaproteobacteria bacterium]